MTTVVKNGTVWSQESETSNPVSDRDGRSPSMWAISTIYSCKLVGSCIKSRASGTQTGTLLRDARVAGGNLICCASKSAESKIFRLRTYIRIFQASVFWWKRFLTMPSKQYLWKRNKLCNKYIFSIFKNSNEVVELALWRSRFSHPYWRTGHIARCFISPSCSLLMGLGKQQGMDQVLESLPWKQENQIQF